MSDKKTYSDLLGMDPRSKPWDWLARQGSKLDQALGTQAGSEKSEVTQKLERLAQLLGSAASMQPMPVAPGTTRDVGYFEDYARAIPKAFSGPSGAMAFPSPAASLARLGEEAVARDHFAQQGAKTVSPFMAQSDLANKAADEGLAFPTGAKIPRIYGAESRNVAKGGYGREGEQDWRSVNVGSDPTLENLRNFKLDSQEAIPPTPAESEIPLGPQSPRAATLEEFLKKWVP